MATARATHWEVRITPHTSGLSGAGVMTVLGGLCVAVGVWPPRGWWTDWRNLSPGFSEAGHSM